MIKIVPDKEGKLTQWDLNRKIIVTGYDGVAEVHFASPGDDHGAYVVELKDGEAEIPNILLTMAGTIKVYVYPTDRTVFATALWVMAREKPDDYVYTETEVLNWRTLDEKIGDLAELTTTARENLVAAINEAATKGMASIYMRVAEGYIEYSGDGVNWKQLIAVSELKGDKGDKGDPGSDATVDIVTPTAESTATQAASAKAVWDMLGGGGSGTDISLGVTGASVGDIVKVKAVDDSGKPTAWEAATAKLANPNALTFTGTVTGSYDGSAPLSIEIPSGGSGGSSGSGESEFPNWRLIKTISFSADIASVDFDTDDAGNTFSLKEIMLAGTVPAYASTGYIYMKPASKSSNNAIWPTAAKDLRWWAASVNGQLITMLAVSGASVIWAVDKNPPCPNDTISRLVIGASDGFSADSTMYVYGR